MMFTAEQARELVRHSVSDLSAVEQQIKTAAHRGLTSIQCYEFGFHLAPFELNEMQKSVIFQLEQAGYKCFVDTRNYCLNISWRE